MTYLQPIKTVFLVLFPFFLWSQSVTNNKAIFDSSYEDLKQLFIKSQGNDKKQKIFANSYIKRARFNNSTINLSRGYYLMSLIYEGNEAIKYLDSSIVFSIQTNDLKFPALSYSRKAYELKKQFRFSEALDNFFMAEKYAKKNNLDFYYNVKHSVGMLRSEELGQVEEALILYRECFNYYKGKDVRSPEYVTEYHNVLFALADAHKSLNNLDSTSFYNKLGYQESMATNDQFYIPLFILNEGANQVLRKNYNEALKSIYKALPQIISNKDYGNMLASYFYLGKSYAGIGNKTKAIQNFIKVDSMYKIKKRITPEFVSGYSYLIDYYKQTGDKENQLKYLNTFMEIDSVLQKEYKHLNNVLQKEYDIPHLFAEKENLIESLKKKQTTSYVGILLLVLLVIATGGFGCHQYYLKKQYRKRFDAIMFPVPIESTNNPKNEDIKIIVEEIVAEEQSRIPSEIVKQLLEKLPLFEKDKAFLEKTITIQKAAVKLNTNTKYLSKVINENKGKTFVSYINDLRVEYAVTQLQAQQKLRNFTVQALANEFGFNSAESFSSAFYKKYKIKPTYFIKELENLK